MDRRRKRADIIYLFKIPNALVDVSLQELFSPIPHNRCLRGHNAQLYLPKPRTDVLKYSFFYRVVKLWNALPDYVCAANTLSSFKTAVTNYLYGPVYLT